MKYIVDAQLPRRIARWLQDRGDDVIHTLDLPLRNRTPDSEINALSMNEQRIVITKDADFVNSFTLTGVPYKLLLISTGNIPNNDLLTLLSANIDIIEFAFATNAYVELSRSTLIIHR